MMILLELKLKNMSKYISDMTYKYINPTTGTPTNVPPLHYEKKYLIKYKNNIWEELLQDNFLL